MNKDYRKALNEVSYIINKLDKEDFDRLPKNFIKMIESEKDKNYKVNILDDIPIYEQNLLKETRAILAVIYRLYLADN